MQVTWLGQAGLLLENNNIKIMIDPYLSNSVEKVNFKNFRRIKVDEKYLEISPDVLIFTHNHLDHYDPETVKRILENSKKSITILCPSSVWKLVKEFGGEQNYVLFDRLTEWTEKSICFKAVKAVHSDEYAIGVVIKDNKKTYYVMGDTLYNEQIFLDLPKKIDYVFSPINGVGNNMNAIDAVRFCKKIKAKNVVPYHYGMFDEISPNIFNVKNKIILETYKKTEI